jgi:NTP pyrophosphatase (non-canonical NTP hydrolase)
MNYESFAEYLNLASESAHENAVRHGFYQDIENLLDYCFVNEIPQYAVTAKRDFVLSQLAKIGSEVGEAVACIQHSERMDGLSEELADIIIRVIDLANWMEYKIGDDVKNKMIKNALRPYMHGKTC